MTFALDHRGSLTCRSTFLHHGGLPGLTMETGQAEAHAWMIVRLGAHVAFIHSHSLKAPMGGGVGMEESQTIHPAMPGPLGKVKGLIVMWYPQLLPQAFKSLSQEPGPSPTFPHAPATTGLNVYSTSLGSPL